MAAEGEVAGLAERPSQELRLAWLKLYRREPPLGLSRDLMIRALANKLQERTHGGPSPAMKRCLNTIAGEFEKRGRSFNRGAVLDGRKAGAAVARTHPHCSGARGRVLIRVEQALAMIKTAGAMDAALIDVNLNGQKSYSMADALAARSVPSSL
jgi:Protein of unknown function (DUF2924)